MESFLPGPVGHQASNRLTSVAAPTRSIRIVVTGSESTGKTTLSRQLAEALHAVWIPEYARAYAETVGRPLLAGDVEKIARGQIAGEDVAIAGGPPLVVQDTDLLSTVVYARHYYGASPAWIDAVAAQRVGSLYLLCDIDLAWVGDGVRDRPFDRQLLDSLFRTTLAEFGAVVAAVSGSGARRLHDALDRIDAWRAAHDPASDSSP
ncbi:MAG: hypothetical protein MNPFHGCM_00162 [Gemmatimonadaceae bacterium]|nr:hypothetical protein [Gemmatimonadaceae bacterium]